MGAHARVYEASDLAEPSRLFALKLMALEPDQMHGVRPRNGVKEVRLNQVLREVELHSMMHHVNVVKLESHFKQEIRFCIVMEHCEGNTLAQLLETIGHLGEASSRNLLGQTLEGLEHIHSRGIIHRDLKPANIYLTSQMIIKIGDFGLADRVGSGRKGICGTPNYISPEALLEQGYTPAVDIWAVGCIAYHMLAGRPPFDAASQSTTYDLIRNHRFLPLPPSQASSGARHLVHWMLSFLPQERPTISFIKSHEWMTKQQRDKKTRRRSRQRNSAPIAQQLEIMSNNSECLASASQENVESFNYELLGGKVSGMSQENEQASNCKSQPFWRHFTEEMKWRITASFQFIPSKILGIRKMSLMRRGGSRTQSHIKRHLERVLKVAPSSNIEGDCSDINDCNEVAVYVCKWIDYSNKFGFGYQMSDGTSGVIFNDNSQICMDGNMMSKVTHVTSQGSSTYSLHSLPASVTVGVTLLDNFREYMDSHLSNDNPRHTASCKPTLIIDWYRTEKAIVFLTQTLLQVNFFGDHIKFLLFSEGPHRKCSLVTIDNSSVMKKYDFIRLNKTGCPEFLFTYLKYIYSIL